MGKILVFLEESKLQPKGGPYGYNYNLKKGLERLGDSNIEIHYLQKEYEEKYVFKNKWLNKIEKKIRFFQAYDLAYLKQYEAYECIHFHTSKHMFKARKFLKTYEGKVLFTSHSPMYLSKEMRQDASKGSRILFFWFFLLLSVIDKYSFNRADILIFPCQEAEQPYENSQLFKNIKKVKKFMYMPTGIEDCESKIKITREEYRKMYGIPQDAFVISYVGRHNKVKGYRILKKVGQRFLNRNSNVYFLIGGKEEPLKGLSNKRWIEVGYTKDPYSLIAASDMFWLPNIQTYFDLVLLEILSLGKTVVTSYTGGNRYFERYKSEGIIYYKHLDELQEKMDYVYMNAKKLETFGKQNREIFEKDFTCIQFANQYLTILQKIVKEKK